MMKKQKQEIKKLVDIDNFDEEVSIHPRGYVHLSV